MPTDRYGLGLSTASAAARDDYVHASDQALTFYPGAAEAYDRAIAADPGFALAHVGKAQVLMRQGDIAGARAALDAAKDVSAGLPHREASHIRFFDLVFAGRTEAAIAALYAHLTAWPRDALVVASAANPNGLIGASGRIGQKHQIAMLMDSLAPHYGDDFWFLSYHAMALCEDGQLAAARMKIEKSVTTNPNNAHGAHGFAHVCGRGPARLSSGSRRQGTLTINGGTVMSDECTHTDAIRDVTPSALGCEECLKSGSEWLHLRLCRICGHYHAAERHWARLLDLFNRALAPH
jgi:tetratricopeptide (TPR) repeat protein